MWIHVLISGAASHFFLISSQSRSWRLSRDADVARSKVTGRQCPLSPPCRCRRCYRRRIINALSQSHASFMRLLSLSLSSFPSLSLHLLRCCRGQVSCLLDLCVSQPAVEAMQFFSSSFWALTIVTRQPVRWGCVSENDWSTFSLSIFTSASHSQMASNRRLGEIGFENNWISPTRAHDADLRKRLWSKFKSLCFRRKELGVRGIRQFFCHSKLADPCSTALIVASC